MFVLAICFNQIYILTTEYEYINEYAEFSGLNWVIILSSVSRL